ncbi:MAG TPA: Slp family lipoprotein [Rhodanobacteraceae bacterium]
MRTQPHWIRIWRPALALLLPIVLAACAPPPLYKSSGASSVNATPQQVATAPTNFGHLEVVWGGRVIAVRNFAHHTEIRILAYPLDSSQRPRLRQPATGRFIASMPGFVEPLNYPGGSLVTVRGTLDGTRQGKVGKASYTFVLVRASALHYWTPAEMRQGHPAIGFGVGVGAGG